MNRVYRQVVGAAAVLLLAGCGGTSQQPAPTGLLAAAADLRAAHAVASTDPDMNCVAKTFGIEPVDAKNIDQVTTIYAWAYCQSKNGATSEWLPAAVDRGGTARIPRDSDFAGDIRRIFPTDVRARVTNGPPPDLTTKVR